MSNVEIFLPPPGQREAAVAFEALAEQMQLRSTVGIVRFVKRRNTPPLLGVLHPGSSGLIAPNGDIVTRACFYFSRLPFAEDIRSYGSSSCDLALTFPQPDVPCRAS
jgi:hypothetical protein